MSQHKPYMVKSMLTCALCHRPAVKSSEASATCIVMPRLRAAARTYSSQHLAWDPTITFFIRSTCLVPVHPGGGSDLLSLLHCLIAPLQRVLRRIP
jgi:hypothetical protein